MKRKKRASEALEYQPDPARIRAAFVGGNYETSLHAVPDMVPWMLCPKCEANEIDLPSRENGRLTTVSLVFAAALPQIETVDLNSPQQ